MTQNDKRIIEYIDKHILRYINGNLFYKNKIRKIIEGCVNVGSRWHSINRVIWLFNNKSIPEGKIVIRLSPDQSGCPTINSLRLGDKREAFALTRARGRLNGEYNGNSKLTFKQVVRIKELKIKGATEKQIIRILKLKVQQPCINKIINNINWKGI